MRVPKQIGEAKTEEEWGPVAALTLYLQFVTFHKEHFNRGGNQCKHPTKSISFYWAQVMTTTLTFPSVSHNTLAA